MNSGFFSYSVFVRSVEWVLGQFGDVIVSGEDIEQEGPGFGSLVQALQGCHLLSTQVEGQDVKVLQDTGFGDGFRDHN